MGHGFLRVYRFSPAQVHSTNAPYSPSRTCCSYQKDKRAKAVNLPKSSAVLEDRETLDIKLLSLCDASKGLKYDFFPESLID
jgi:hypothetical protein